MWVALLLPAQVFAADEALTLMDRGFVRRAGTLCEQRIAKDPKDATATAVLARVRAEQGQLDEAIRLATAAVAADPRNADAQYAVSEVYGAKAQSVSKLLAGGFAGKMKKAAEAAVAIDPKHVDALEILVEFHRRAPGIMGGDKKKGAEYLERLIQVDPVSGWIRKASVARGEKDTNTAAQCYAKAVAVAPQSGRALVSQASWLAPPYRDPAKAEKLALQATQLEPTRAGGWQVLAALYAHQQRWDELESVLQRSEAAEPTHLAPWFQAGRQLLLDGREPVRAERYMRKYLSREPELGSYAHAAARWQLGLALERQGKKAEATAEIAAAVKADPKLDDAKKDLKRLKG
jgi:tetratricopeptide (TPR) repeat protein